jgi:type IV pilus assembly protein PilB
MIEMGVESYLVRATLIGVLAQRLVRRICAECRTVDEDPHLHVRELLGVDAAEVFYRGQGCTACGGTGIRGRCMTYEYLVATPALRQLIVPGVDEAVLSVQATTDGMVPLVQHSLSLARAGTITLLEAYRTRVE